MKTLLLIITVASACGYSELEMQAQRDKTNGVIDVLDRLAADQAVCRQRLASKASELEALRAECHQEGAPQ